MTADKPATPKAPPKNSRTAPNKLSAKTSGLTVDQRNGLREILEDVYVLNKWKIIRMNFLRGMAFGLGTFLGGTIVVAILVWILSQTIDLFPPIRDFTERLIDSLQKR
jgi:hypothetical protein